MRWECKILFSYFLSALQIFDWCIHQVMTKKVPITGDRATKLANFLHSFTLNEEGEEENEETAEVDVQIDISRDEIEVIERVCGGSIVGCRKRAKKVEEDTGREVLFTSVAGERETSKTISSVVYLRDRACFGRINNFILVQNAETGTKTWALVKKYTECRLDQDSQCFFSSNDLSSDLLPVCVDNLEDPLIFAVLDDTVWFINPSIERRFLNSSSLA